MTLRTNSEVEAALEALEALVGAQGVSKNEAILRAILRDRDRLNLDADVLEAYASVSTEYRGALDRLGSV